MAIFAAVLFGFWWQDRARIHTLAFAYWAFAFCGGIILQGVVPWNFAPYDILLFHLNATSALIVMFWGIGKRDDNPTPVAAMFALVALSMPILYFSRLFENQAVLLMTQNFTIGLLFALIAQSKSQVVPKNVADRIIVWVFYALAGYTIVRPSTTVLAQSQMSMAEYQASIFASLNIVVSSLLALMLALSLIAMVVLDNIRRERDEAAIDPLSGLPNRREFETKAKAMMARASAEKRWLSVIVADIDHFKHVNDTWGHSAGDAVIQKFARLLSAEIRPSDVAGRIGGEEFCLVIWNCDAQQAFALAERIRRATARLQARQDDEDIAVSASFGVAQWQLGMRYSEVFAQADKALYAAKDSGRNRVVASDDAGTDSTIVPIAGASDCSGGKVIALSR